MRQVPASFVLRLLSLAFGIAGLALVALGAATLASPAAGEPRVDAGFTIVGALILLVGVAGPLRIVLTGAQVPAEVRQSLVVQGVAFPVAGFVLVVAGLYSTTWTQAAAFLICGICALASSVAGFYRLSKRLPATFYIDEMAAIMKSAGLLGRRQHSPADREFMRWSKGSRAGVPVGRAAPDGLVVTLEGETRRLSEFFEPGGGESPLVLNLGSYSCPHQRKRIDELHELIDRWESRGVRFLTVYTAEAHPEDGWKLEDQYRNDPEYTGSPDDFCFFYAKTIEDRRDMAQWLIDKKSFRMPVVLDAMEDSLLFAYNSWPIRLYIVDDGTVVYSGKQGPFGYAPDEVDGALEELLGARLRISFRAPLK